MNGRPIETAPKDGTRIIGYGPNTLRAGEKSFLWAEMEYRQGGWWRDNRGQGFTISFHPTHWIPTPKLQS